jgi:hypothetical protein
MNALANQTAKSIVAAIIADGAAGAYLGASEEQRTEMMLAYLQNQIKKTEQLQTMYMTNDSFRDHFRQTVYELCK